MFQLIIGIIFSQVIILCLQLSNNLNYAEAILNNEPIIVLEIDNKNFDFNQTASKLNNSKVQAEVIKNLNLKTTVKLANRKIELLNQQSQKKFDLSKQILKIAADKVNSYVSIVNKQLNLWAQEEKNKLNSFPNSTKEEVIDEIEKFLNEKLEELKSCAKISFKSITEQFKIIQNTIESNINAIENTFNEISNCVNNDENTDSLECVINIRQSITKLNLAEIRTENLKINTLNRLSVTVLNESCYANLQENIKQSENEFSKKSKQNLDSYRN